MGLFYVMILIMRIIVLIIFLIVTLPAHADVTDGLVGWWKFDDGSGTTPIDSSGLGNNATFAYTPTWVSGKKNSALSFNGSNTMVTRNSVTTLNSSRTVCFWFNSNALGAQKGIVSVGDVINENVPLWLMVTKATDVLSIYQNGYLDGVTTLSTGVWYFGAYTFNSSSNAVQLYLNGNLENSTTRADYGTAKNATLYIGQGYSAYFNGLIDDLRIYNRALSQTEIKAIYMSGTPHAVIKGQGRVGNLRMK